MWLKLNQLQLSLSDHLPAVCKFVPAAAAQEEPDSRSHSSEFGQCAGVEVAVWQWEMGRAGDSGEGQLEQQAVPREQPRGTIGGSSTVKEDKSLSP